MGLLDITPGQGALGAGALGLLGGLLTNDANAERADAANQWSAQQFATRYQTMTKDLEAAGLNPMLAYSQSPGSAPTAQQVTFQNPMSAATQGYSQAAGAVQSLSSANQADAMVKQVDATVEKIKAETRFVETDEKRLHFTIENLYQLNNNLAQEGKNLMVREKILEQTLIQAANENIITAMDIKAMKETGGIGRIARELKPVSDIGTDVIDSLKIWKSKNVKETGTTYDRRGNPSGGYSRERFER